MNVLRPVYKLIKEVSEKFDVFYPYQEMPVDLKKGYITFHQVGSKQIISRQERVLSDSEIETSIINEVEVQINVYKYIDYIAYDRGELSSEAMLNKIVVYLNTSIARDKLYEQGIELAGITSKIMISTSYDENNKWLEEANFRFKVYERQKYISVDNLINQADIDLKNIGGI